MLDLEISNELMKIIESGLSLNSRDSVLTTNEFTIQSIFESSTTDTNFINSTSIPTTIETTRPVANQTSLSIIVRIIAYTIIFIASLIGNISVLTTLILTRRLRTVTNAFLINLAISDLLLGVFCMPFTLAGSISRNFAFGPVMCKLIPYFQAISVGVSAWTLVAISFERYFAICHPLESRRWQTISHSYRVIAIIWLANVLVMSPIAFLSKLLPTKTAGKLKCREEWPSSTSEELFNLILLFLLLIIPFIIMATTYAFVSKELYGDNLFLNQKDNRVATRFGANNNNNNNNNNSHHRLQRNSSPSADRNTNSDVRIRDNSNNVTSMAVTYNCRSGHINIISEHSTDSTNQSRFPDSNSTNQIVRIKKIRLGNSRRTSTQLISKKRIIRMLCVLVLEFFICWTPVYVLNVWALYAPKQVYSILGPTSISFIHLLSYLSSCTNPITYCFMHRKFRDIISSLLKMIGSFPLLMVLFPFGLGFHSIQAHIFYTRIHNSLWKLFFLMIITSKYLAALMMMIRNRGSSHNYLLSELDQSTSNQSPSSLITSNQSNNTSSTTLSHNSHSYNINNNNQSNNEFSQQRFGNYLTPKIKIRNAVF